MPKISYFLGITIMMYFDDHLPPHFHAAYSGDKFVIGILPVAVLQGQPSPRIRSLLFEWTALYQKELLQNWELCREKMTPHPIEPLS